MYVLSIVVCPFVLFLLAIVLSVLFRYTVFDCPFGIFKLFSKPAVELYYLLMSINVTSGHKSLGFFLIKNYVNS